MDTNTLTRELKRDQVNAFVLRKQHLTPDTKGKNVLEVVSDLAGLHAQVPTTPYLSLFARTKDFKREKLEHELYVTWRLVKLRGVRQTVFVMPRDLVAVLWAVTHAQVEKMSTRYMESLGVSAKEFEHWSKKIVKLLENQELSVAELKAQLETKVNLSAIVNLLCDQFVLLRGRPRHGWKDGTPRYVVRRETLPDVTLELTERSALVELVRRYLTAFAPVTESDIVWWTGLAKGKVRAALEALRDELVSVKLASEVGEFVMLEPDFEQLQKTKAPRVPTVALLPVLDSYVMGYKERNRYLNPTWTPYVFDRSGNATSTITVSGQIVGVWDFEDGNPPVVKLFLFEKVSKDVLKDIRAKAKEVGRFIAEAEVELRECTKMVSLLERTAGGYLSPLKGY